MTRYGIYNATSSLTIELVADFVTGGINLDALFLSFFFH